MFVSGFLFFFAAICGLGAVVSAVLITAWLDRRGTRTPFPFIGSFLVGNIRRYRKATLETAGSVGPLFYACVVPLLVALLLVIAGILLRRGWGL